MISRRTALGLIGIASASAVAGQTPPPTGETGLPAGLPDPSETIDLWPAGAPGAPAVLPVESVNERSSDRQLTDRAVLGISRSRMAVFRPDRPNGAAVLLMPGGGYRWVVVDKEGYEMARWLAARGFTAFVLFYRVPGAGWANRADVPLADAARAMRLIRHRATDFAIDPARVAAMGFSAGGHVCADLATRFAVPVYDAIDEADQISARPHCAAPLYPVVSMDPAIAHAGSRSLLLGDNPSPEMERLHSPDRNVPPDAPPHFLLHAADDDAVPLANTLRLHASLMERGIAAEMHIFAAGGHGFGLRKTVGKPVEVWPELWREWARTQGLG